MAGSMAVHHSVMFCVMQCRPPLIRVNDRVSIPQEEHPEINFVGLLIGPRGNTLRNIEKEVCVVYAHI